MLALLALLLLLPGCIVRRRQPLPEATAAPLWRTATLEELLDNVQAQQEAIQTINATVELEPSVRYPQRGEIVHYRDVRAFLLIRKPAFIRMIGQYPVVRNTAFDMASDGNRFGLYIPSKNRFIIGDSAGKGHSESALENLRPQHILDALLIHGPTESEQAALEAFNNGQRAYYVVHVLQPDGGGGLLLDRNLWFERQDLSLERLQIFGEGGEIVTDVSYSNYGEFGGISYPQQIVMDRPQDKYGLRLTVTRLVFNEPLGDEKFLLERPTGTELVDLEEQTDEEDLSGGEEGVG